MQLRSLPEDHEALAPLKLEDVNHHPRALGLPWPPETDQSCLSSEKETSGTH